MTFQDLCAAEAPNAFMERLREVFDYPRLSPGDFAALQQQLEDAVKSRDLTHESGPAKPWSNSGH